MGTVVRRDSVNRSGPNQRIPAGLCATGSTAEAPGVNRRSARPSGSTIFSAETWERIACQLGLSGRELQIVRGTFDDRTESAIAADLQIATSTVHTHVERLHRKLVVADRAQLILRVVQEYLALAEAPENRLPLISAVQASIGRPFALNGKRRIRRS